jgi:hypothetical protein
MPWLFYWKDYKVMGTENGGWRGGEERGSFLLEGHEMMNPGFHLLKSDHLPAAPAATS